MITIHTDALIGEQPMLRKYGDVPRPAFVELSPTGHVTLGWTNFLSADAVHMRALRWGISPHVTKADIVHCLTRLRDSFAALLTEHHVEWDGDYWSGRLTDTGEKLYCRIDEALRQL